MYTHIIDPQENISHSIYSNQGKYILKTYLKRISGNKTLKNTPIIHKKSSTQIKSLSFKKTSVIKKSLKSIQKDKDYNIIFNTIESSNYYGNSTQSKYDIVVFSADYDGCWDILFNPIKRLLINNKKYGRLNYLYARNKLVFNIKGFLKRSNKHILLVGSARQSVEMDKHNRNIHSGLHKEMGILYKKHEGYCLKDFTTLSKDNKWTLLRFLYPDISKASYLNVAKNLLLDINDRKRGNLNNKNLVWSNPKLFTKKKLISKKEIILSQIKILNILYPKKKILFIFYDDDNSGTLFNSLLIKLKEKKTPSNITIKLYRFNWFNILNNGDDLTEIT